MCKSFWGTHANLLTEGEQRESRGRAAFAHRDAGWIRLLHPRLGHARRGLDASAEMRHFLRQIPCGPSVATRGVSQHLSLLIKDTALLPAALALLPSTVKQKTEGGRGRRDKWRRKPRRQKVQERAKGGGIFFKCRVDTKSENVFPSPATHTF